VTGIFGTVPPAWVAVFLVAYFLSGAALGSVARKIPPLFGYPYLPPRGWLYALFIFSATSLFFELRVLESFLVYGLPLREGFWPFLWSVAGTYAIGMGYSGQPWPKTAVRVREWKTGQRSNGVAATSKQESEL